MVPVLSRAMLGVDDPGAPIGADLAGGHQALPDGLCLMDAVNSLDHGVEHRVDHGSVGIIVSLGPKIDVGAVAACRR